MSPSIHSPAIHAYARLHGCTLIQAYRAQEARTKREREGGLRSTNLTK